MIEIAIADDSAVIRNLIEEVLQYTAGYALVASFDNGRDIVAWAREGGTADVFVIDMRLPGLSGTATISALRRHNDVARILAFSASAQEESVKSALAAGADGYLLKESTLKELMTAISVPGKTAEDGVAPAEPSEPNAAKDTSADNRGSGLRVLVVDDHDLVRDATTAMLEAKAFEVASCDSGAAARAWLASGNSCDAALVDLRLGDESGAAIVEAFREFTPDTAVVLHSGAADQDGARVARETGADGFLAKGDYTIDQMVEYLTGAIERRRSADGN
ncbi:MAG: response regulator [Solirubrobacterales bacterium]